MKLFIVKNIHTKKTFAHRETVFDTYSTSNKEEAKRTRDALNGGLCFEPDKTWLADKGWRVTYGPDHWRYTS